MPGTLERRCISNLDSLIINGGKNSTNEKVQGQVIGIDLGTTNSCVAGMWTYDCSVMR
jgi:hypothetical protein